MLRKLRLLGTSPASLPSPPTDISTLTTHCPHCLPASPPATLATCQLCCLPVPRCSERTKHIDLQRRGRDKDFGRPPGSGLGSEVRRKRRWYQGSREGSRIFSWEDVGCCCHSSTILLLLSSALEFQGQKDRGRSQRGTPHVTGQAGAQTVYGCQQGQAEQGQCDGFGVHGLSQDGARMSFLLWHEVQVRSWGQAWTEARHRETWAEGGPGGKMQNKTVSEVHTEIILKCLLWKTM